MYNLNLVRFIFYVSGQIVSWAWARKYPERSAIHITPWDCMYISVCKNGLEWFKSVAIKKEFFIPYILQFVSTTRFKMIGAELLLQSMLRFKYYTLHPIIKIIRVTYLLEYRKIWMVYSDFIITIYITLCVNLMVFDSNNYSLKTFLLLDVWKSQFFAVIKTDIARRATS